MNPHQTDAYKYLGQAQQARKAGDKRLARQYAEQAARLAPELEDVWLMMAALASPRASVVFMEKALQINPNSERVHQGMHWAVERLKNEPVKVLTASPVPVAEPETEAKPARSLSRTPLLAILMALMCLGIFVFSVWMAPSIARAASVMIDSSTRSQNTPAWAVANIAKASPSSAAAASATANPTRTGMIPTAAPTRTDVPTEGIILTAGPTRTDVPTDGMIPTAAATEIIAAGVSTMDVPIIADTATPQADDTNNSADATPTALPTDTPMPAATQYVVPTPGPNGSGGSNTGRWIDVDLTHQAVYAYDGNTLVKSFIVSTGTWQHPTVTGQYHVYIKYLYKDMTGPGYYLPNVPYTMFFYQGYAIHGTYWHSNFGTPMSHGCVNLSIPDSEWMYNWASVGTLVNVHY